MFPETPRPPATVKEPEVFEVEAVVSVTLIVVDVTAPVFESPWTSKLNPGADVPIPTLDVAMTFVALGVAL